MFSFSSAFSETVPLTKCHLYFPKARTVENGRFKRQHSDLERGRQSRTCLEDGIYCLLETRAAVVFHACQSDGFRLSVPETEIQQFNSGGSVILLTDFLFFFFGSPNTGI